VSKRLTSYLPYNKFSLINLEACIAVNKYQIIIFINIWWSRGSTADATPKCIDSNLTKVMWMPEPTFILISLNIMYIISEATLEPEDDRNRQIVTKMYFRSPKYGEKLNLWMLFLQVQGAIN
jgi:hypothetical protein